MRNIIIVLLMITVVVLIAFGAGIFSGTPKTEHGYTQDHTLPIGIQSSYYQLVPAEVISWEAEEF
jgi:hypothetical protein